MAALTIPEKHRSGMAKLRSLQEAQIEALSSALATADLAGTSSKRMADRIAAQVPGVSPEDLADITATLVSLCVVRGDVSVKRFAADLVDAMNETDDASLIVADGERSAFERRLARLLQIQSLNFAAKTTDLRFEYANVFCEARIITDMRPIFGADPSDAPSGVIVTHTLKIQYHGAGGDLHELYVALTAEDIMDLKTILRRAETKADSIKALLKKCHIDDLDGKPEE